jgi:hypothetical protein
VWVYQQQEEQEEQPLPQQVEAPGVRATTCAPRWHVDPILLVKVTMEGENCFLPRSPPNRATSSGELLMRMLPPSEILRACRQKQGRGLRKCFSGYGGVYH